MVINSDIGRINGFISSSRNCFLLTTVGVAVFGFGGLTGKRKGFVFVRFISLMIYVIALLYLINMCVAFNSHMNALKEEKLELPEYDMLYYKMSLYIVILYGIAVLVPLIYLGSKKFIEMGEKLNKKKLLKFLDKLLKK